MFITIHIPNHQLPEEFRGIEGRQNVIDQIAWMTEVMSDKKIEFLSKPESERNPVEGEFIDNELKLANLIKNNLKVIMVENPTVAVLMLDKSLIGVYTDSYQANRVIKDYREQCDLPPSNDQFFILEKPVLGS